MIGTGDKQTVESVKQQIHDARMQDNIILKGFLSDHEVYSYIKAGKLFIFPSHEEGFGIVLAEAMVCETAVVAYDLPVYRNTFRRSISTANCFDTSDFAAQITSLLESETKRKSQIDSSREVAKHFSWQACGIREQKQLLSMF